MPDSSMDLEQNRPDFRQYLRSFWRRRWLLLAIVVLIPAAIYTISALLPKTYESSTLVQARTTSLNPAAFSSQVSVAMPSAQEAVQLVETTTVATKAAQELGDPPSEGERLLQDITAVPEVEGTAPAAAQLFTITARAGSPERAADVANAFATGLAEVREEKAVEVIDQTIDSLRLQPEGGEETGGGNLTEEFQLLEALKAGQSANTQIIERATVPEGPASPKPVRNTALGLVFALLLAGGLVPLLDRIDRRVHDAEQAEGIVGTSLLAAIPDAAFPGRPPAPYVRESFQTLRSSLTYFNIDRSLTHVLVASPEAGDGKTTVSINFAVALARANMHVVLADTDLRRSPIARRLGAEGRYGLDSVLLGERRLEDALEDVDAGGGRLQVLSGGSTPPDPGVLLGSRKMREVLAELGELADMVVIDTPALVVVSDAMPLLAQASGIVMVARLEYTSRHALSRACEVVTSTNGKLLGVVVTGVRPGDSYSYGRYYGYGYGYPSEQDGDGAGHSGEARAGRFTSAVRGVTKRFSGSRPNTGGQ